LVDATPKRKSKDLEELNAIENIQGVRLDVNKQDQIDAAVKTITKAGRGLYGLVNNAEVVVAQPLIEIEEQDFDFQMNVNIYGPYRVTRAFAPLIIEPGAYRSNIGKSALERMEERNQSADNSKLKEAMGETVNWLSLFENGHGNPTEVAATVIKALFDDNPKPRYLIVPTQEQAYWTISRGSELTETTNCRERPRWLSIATRRARRTHQQSRCRKSRCCNRACPGTSPEVRR
jgi:NAD(P)-dependent dehydrogenase (short-subunit alcohol dehydrogenase family)